MKKIPSLIFFFLITLHLGWSQSIRKDHREMTQTERDALVAALYELRDGPDIVDRLATFHASSHHIHRQLPHNPAGDVFLAWHRYFILEMEHALQNINPKLSLPYWDWTTDQTRDADALLWSNFMGPFDKDWNLGRNLGLPVLLPDEDDIRIIQNRTDWLHYSNSLERGPHDYVHLWVGGKMRASDSPRDPVFYLHHSMVDKLWQDWVETNNITPASNLYQSTTMPRYEEQALPAVNPNDIVDSKALGVFYAYKGIAKLHNYTVANTYHPVENFYYRDTIEVKDNFMVPAFKSVEVESVKLVILKPGFHAQEGSTFTAKIDQDNNINTSKRTTSSTVQHKYNPFPDIGAIKNFYHQDRTTQNITFELFPNPVVQIVTLRMSDICEGCPVTIYNLNGKLVHQQTLAGKLQPTIDVGNLTTGVYLVRVKQKNGNVVTQKLVKK